MPNIRDARWSLVWGLFFISLIYWSAPAYGVFARIQELHAHTIPDPATARSVADMVVINAAINGGLPSWLVGVLAAGALEFRFLYRGGAPDHRSGLHFVRYCSAARRPESASETRKMTVAKVSAILLAAVVLLVALKPPGLIVEIIAVAFALAGNTIFPVFVLGIWWGRANRQGAIAGMLTGSLITFAEPLFGGMSPLVGQFLPLTSSALIGAPVVIGVIIAVSLLTAPPSDEMRRFLAKDPRASGLIG